MRLLFLVLVASALAVSAHSEASSELRVEFTNPSLTPSEWTLVIHPDGSAHFHSERVALGSGPSQTIEAVAVDRDVRLSEEFAGHVFQTVHHHNLLNENCESHYKVAFQGWKSLSYVGPDGTGSCRFNYSKDHDIQSLGESFVAVASTILEGARLELLRQHDPLGLDKEMGYLLEAAGDGRLQQLCAIRGILQRLEEDPEVMERVRRQARRLLAQSSK